MSQRKTVILLAASTWFPLSARLAMAFLRHGCSVAAIVPPGHPLAFVPGIETLYPYRGVRSLHSLRRAILAASPDIIVPCDEGVVHQLHTLHTEQPSLRPLIERSLGAPESYPILESRDLLLNLADEIGIRTPATQTMYSEADLTCWPHQSAVFKTDGSTGGNGVAITHNPSEQLAAYRRLNQPLTAATALKRYLINRNPLSLWRWQKHAKPAIALQQFVPGRPANTMFACWHGKVLAAVTVEVLCSQGPTGAATVVRFIQNREIEQASRKLAHRLLLSGFYGLDFILDPNQNAWLIELNPRCTQLGHLNLPGQGSLAEILATKVSRKHSTDTLPDNPIEGNIVAFFPQALNWNPSSPYLAKAFHDIPANAPALVTDLQLEEWPYRQLPARLYHRFFPPSRHTKAPFENATTYPASDEASHHTDPSKAPQLNPQ